MIYVDAAIHKRRGTKTTRALSWGHLFADTLEELHSFARQLGLSARRFDDRRWPHYDVSVEESVAAQIAGAVKVDRKFVVEFSRHETRRVQC